MNKLKMQVEEVLEILNTEYEGAQFTKDVNAKYEKMLEDDVGGYSELLLDITEYIDADRGQDMENVENVIGMILGLVVILAQSVLFLKFTLKNMEDEIRGR